MSGSAPIWRGSPSQSVVLVEASAIDPVPTVGEAGCWWTSRPPARFTSSGGEAVWLLAPCVSPPPNGCCTEPVR